MTRADSSRNDPSGSAVSNTRLSHALMALLGGLITAAMIGTLIFESVRGGPQGANLHFSTLAIDAVSSGHEVRFQIENLGKSTARALEVEVSLMEGGSAVETASVTLDYAPDGARRSAAVFFQRDPARYEISFQPLGYDTP